MTPLPELLQLLGGAPSRAAQDDSLSDWEIQHKKGNQSHNTQQKMKGRRQ